MGVSSETHWRDGGARSKSKARDECQNYFHQMFWWTTPKLRVGHITEGFLEKVRQALRTSIQ
jgi:hypothetical protein